MSYVISCCILSAPAQGKWSLHAEEEHTMHNQAPIPHARKNGTKCSTQWLSATFNSLAFLPNTYHPQRNKYISNSRRFFDVYVFVLNSNSLAKNNFHTCVSVSVTREIPAKSAGYVHLIRNRWCLEFSRMRMCIEFIIQVAKQKNAHVFSPVAEHLQESRGPPGRKLPTSLKKVFLALPARSVKRAPEQKDREVPPT